LPTFVQVTCVAALMVSENGLNEPPPPAIVTLVVAVGMQAGCGFGLGEGLALGEGLGLGEGVCAGEIVALAQRAIALRAATAQR